MVSVGENRSHDRLGASRNVVVMVGGQIRRQIARLRFDFVDQLKYVIPGARSASSRRRNGHLRPIGQRATALGHDHAILDNAFDFHDAILTGKRQQS